MRKVGKDVLSPSVAFEQVLREARSHEAASIKAGKWFMAAYCRVMVDKLEAIGRTAQDEGSLVTREGTLVSQMRYLLLRAQQPLAADAPLNPALAERMALAVYARKVLRLAGYRVPHPNREQAWLRRQQRFTEQGDVIVNKQEGTNNVRYARG